MTLLKENSINERKREHFSTLLSRLSTVNSLVQIPQKPTVEYLYFLPTMEDIQKTTKQISSGKAPGTDKISAENFKTASPVALATFNTILISIWEEEDMPKISGMPQ